jgi:hypothetical protein
LQLSFLVPLWRIRAFIRGIRGKKKRIRVFIRGIYRHFIGTGCGKKKKAKLY